MIGLETLGHINVKDAPYSAVGDGVTDDTTAIRTAQASAISQGRVLYFPKGTYMVSRTPSALYGGFGTFPIPAGATLRVCGAGMDASKIKWIGNNVSGDSRSIFASNEGNTLFTLEDIHLEGSESDGGNRYDVVADPPATTRGYYTNGGNAVARFNRVRLTKFSHPVWFRAEIRGAITNYEEWTAAHAYAKYTVAKNTAANKLYVATTGGTSHASTAPTGSGNGVTDGTVTWDELRSGVELGCGAQVYVIDCEIKNRMTGISGGSGKEPGGSQLWMRGGYIDADSDGVVTDGGNGGHSFYINERVCIDAAHVHFRGGAERAYQHFGGSLDGPALWARVDNCTFGPDYAEHMVLGSRAKTKVTNCNFIMGPRRKDRWAAVAPAWPGQTYPNYSINALGGGSFKSCTWDWVGVNPGSAGPSFIEGGLSGDVELEFEDCDFGMLSVGTYATASAGGTMIQKVNATSLTQPWVFRNCRFGNGSAGAPNIIVRYGLCDIINCTFNGTTTSGYVQQTGGYVRYFDNRFMGAVNAQITVSGEHGYASGPTVAEFWRNHQIGNGYLSFLTSTNGVRVKGGENTPYSTLPYSVSTDPATSPSIIGKVRLPQGAGTVQYNAQPAAWATGTTYSVNDIRRSGAVTYICNGAGQSHGATGPSSTAYSTITDNAATWRVLTLGSDAYLQFGFDGDFYVVDQGGGPTISGFYMHGPNPGRVNNWLMDGQEITLITVQAATFASDGNLVPINTSARAANSATRWRYAASTSKFYEIGAK